MPCPLEEQFREDLKIVYKKTYSVGLWPQGRETVPIYRERRTHGWAATGSIFLMTD